MVDLVGAVAFSLLSLVTCFVGGSFFAKRKWCAGINFCILSLISLSLSGWLIFSAGQGRATALESGHYLVIVCARRDNVQHCLLDSLEDRTKNVRYYTFPATLERERLEIRDYDTYPPKHIISFYDFGGNSFVLMPTHLIYE